MRRTVTCVGALALALGGAAAGKASKAISANPSSASTESTYNIPNDITMMRCDPPLTEIDPDVRTSSSSHPCLLAVAARITECVLSIAGRVQRRNASVLCK